MIRVSDPGKGGSKVDFSDLKLAILINRFWNAVAKSDL
jgi:hypothetical protein